MDVMGKELLFDWIKGLFDRRKDMAGITNLAQEHTNGKLTDPESEPIVILLSGHRIKLLLE